MKTLTVNQLIKKLEEETAQMSINERLKKFRQSIGISQKEMAKDLSMRQSHLSDMENGRRTVSKKMIDKLSNTYDLSKDWMYTGKGAISTQKMGNSVHDVEYPNIDSSTYDIQVSSQQLNDIIEIQIRNIEFFCTDILYRSYHMNNPANDTKADKEIKKIQDYITQYKGDFIENIKPPYLELEASKKIELIKELSTATQYLLERIWDLTQTIWLRK